MQEHRVGEITVSHPSMHLSLQVHWRGSNLHSDDSVACVLSGRKLRRTAADAEAWPWWRRGGCRRPLRGLYVGRRGEGADGGRSGGRCRDGTRRHGRQLTDNPGAGGWPAKSSLQACSEGHAEGEHPFHQVPNSTFYYPAL